MVAYRNQRQATFHPTHQDIETIGLIYESASRPQLWPDILDRIARSLNGGAAVIALVDTQYGEASIAHYSPIFTPGDIRDYHESYIKHDRVEPVFNAPAGRIVTDHDVWPNRNEFRANPVIQWRRERFGLPHSWGMNLNNREGWKDALLIQCPEPPQALPEFAKRRALFFFPHIARSLRLSRLRAIGEARYRKFSAALDRIDVGIALLHRDRQVIFVNEEARRIFSQRGGLSGKTGRLRAELAADDLAFQQLISEALTAVESDGPSTGGGQCVVQCRDGGEACLIEVAPIRDPDFMDGVIVVIIDPTHRSSFKLNGLSLIFGLTGAEMAICQLLSEGLTNKEIADARNTLLSTVKSQMTSVLNKTGCANRTALLRLIFKINPPFNR